MYVISKGIIKNGCFSALAGRAQLVGHHLLHQKVASLKSGHMSGLQVQYLIEGV